MYDAAIGVIINLLAFTGMGLGPALILLSTEKRLEIGLAIAPALGFALTSIFGTYLVLLDQPVSAWAVPWLTISLFISLVLCLVAVWKKKLGFDQADWRLVALFAFGLGVSTTLVVTPIIIGGLNFTLLRGNGSDAFNYIAMAGYLDYEPYSWHLWADLQALIDRHPSYYLASQLLHARWTTSALLAYTSRIGQLPLYRFDYGFSTLCWILALGPALWLALLMKLRPLAALLLAIAVCVGFWAQFVLDIRALSQMNSIPIVLLFALLMARIESNPTLSTWGEQVLLSISLTALMLLYPEIVPMIVLGLAIFLGTSLFHGLFSIRQATKHSLSLGLTFVSLLPTASFLISFIQQQINYAASGQNTWHDVFFSWLYTDPLIGLWGLSYLAIDEQMGQFVSPGLLKASMLLLGVSLSLSFFVLIVYLFSEREYPPATSISAALALAALLQFFFLWSQGKLWAAAKALSFGYPFIMMGAVALPLAAWPLPYSGWSRALATIVKWGAGLWVVSQCLLGVYRIGFVSAGIDYPNYINQHSEYRHHDWNVAPFVDVLQKEKGATVWLATPNVWVAEYLGYVLGWQVNLVNLNGITNRNEILVGQQTLSSPPSYLLTSKTYWLESLDNITPHIMAQNSEFLLIKLPSAPKFVVLTGIRNLNGLGLVDGELFLWIGQGETVIRVFSPQAGTLALAGHFRPGPSLSGTDIRRLLVKTDHGYEQEERFTGIGHRLITIPIASGLTEIMLRSLDQPTVAQLANGDTRPLLLGIKGPRLIGPMTDENPATIIKIENPNGLESRDGELFFWIGQGETVINIFSARAGNALLIGYILPGPSLPGTNVRRLRIQTDHGYDQEVSFTQEGNGRVAVPVITGTTKVVLQPLDEPTVTQLANGDTRPLLIGVQGLQINFEKRNP